MQGGVKKHFRRAGFVGLLTIGLTAASLLVPFALFLAISLWPFAILWSLGELIMAAVNGMRQPAPVVDTTKSIFSRPAGRLGWGLFLVGCTGIFLYVGAGLLFGPQPLTYLSYAISTYRSSDEILQKVSCGDSTLQVVHSDQALQGSVASLDQEGHSPMLINKYYLQGSVGGKELFSVGHNVPLNIPTQVTLSYYEPTLSNLKKIYVVDRDLFDYSIAGDNPVYILVPPTAISASDLEHLSQCYYQNRQALRSKSQLPVAAFVLTDERNGFPIVTPKATFACTNKHTLVVQGNLVRLDGQTNNIIGELSPDGSVHPRSISQGRTQTPYTPYKDMGMPEPINGRVDVSQWSECALGGLTFKEYIGHLSQKGEYFD